MTGKKAGLGLAAAFCAAFAVGLFAGSVWKNDAAVSGIPVIPPDKAAVSIGTAEAYGWPRRTFHNDGAALVFERGKDSEGRVGFTMKLQEWIAPNVTCYAVESQKGYVYAVGDDYPVANQRAVFVYPASGMGVYYETPKNGAPYEGDVITYTLYSRGDASFLFPLKKTVVVAPEPPGADTFRAEGEDSFVRFE